VRRWRLLEGGAVEVEEKTKKAGLYAGKIGRRGLLVWARDYC
jgi:hypothetical protein